MAKTFSGYKLHGHMKYQGLDISIENERGSVRRGEDPNGKPWATFMHIPYGYIKTTEGVDGDHVDCYIGPNWNSQLVFVIHQQDPATKKYDEDKVMLGFNTEQEARKAYERQYDRPGFFQSMMIITMNRFKVLLKERYGLKLKSNKVCKELKEQQEQKTVMALPVNSDQLMEKAVPVKKLVTRRGRTFLQTFWVASKKEAEEHRQRDEAENRGDVVHSPDKMKDTVYIREAQEIMDFAPDEKLVVEKIKALQSHMYTEGERPTIEQVREVLATEMEWALKHEKDTGKDWYSTKVKKTRAIMTEAFPELAEDGQWGLFTAILAVTSPNKNVIMNTRDAVDIYRGYRETGKIPLKRDTGKNWGLEGSINALKFLQEKLDSGMSPADLTNFLQQGMVGSELSKIYPSASGINKTEWYPVSRIFGPKVGAFFANLTGNYEFTTVDTWASRTWYRVTNQIKDFQTSQGTVAVYDKVTPIDRRNIDSLFKSLGEEFGLTKADTQAVLWYYEKRLYAKIGAGTGSSEDIDYETAVRRIFDGNVGRKSGKGGKNAGAEKATDLSRSMDSIEKGEEKIKLVMKAKYIKRWKGKDGKWHYEYPTEKKGRPAGSYEQGVKKAQRDVLKSTGNKYEKAILLDKDGAVLDATTGDDDSVSLSKKGIQALKQGKVKIMIHNHPGSPWDVYDVSGSDNLSAGDLALAEYYGVPIQAITPSYIYTYIPKQDNLKKNIDDFYDNVFSDFDTIMGKKVRDRRDEAVAYAMQEEAGILNRKNNAYRTFEAVICHNTVLEFAQIYGGVYKKEVNHGK